MIQKWRKAAELFRESNEKKKEDQSRKKEMRPSAPRYEPGVVAQATRELELFMRNEEGQAAMELLEASGRHITFGEDRDGGGFTTVYALTCNGLIRSEEAFGTWTLYATDVPRPKESSLDAREAIEAAINPQMGSLKPSLVMSWLRNELDKIAHAAPKMNQVEVFAH